MASELSRKARGKGSIVGVCVCDALGGPVQFQARSTLRPVEGYRYISQFDQPPGAWSDDGSLTLCLAQSLSDRQGYDSRDFIQRVCDWANHGYLSSAEQAWDEGLATRNACSTWTNAITEAKNQNVSLDMAKTQVKIDRDLKKERRSGNGSLMRVAPVGVMFHGSSDIASQVARQQSELTHPYEACGEACVIYTALICGCYNGLAKQALAEMIAASDVSNNALRERLSAYSSLSDWAKRDAQDIRSSGWVIDTLEAALWAFFTTPTFSEGALKAVNLGDDADTVGAVYGGLAGAYYGIDGIPISWKEGLVKKELVNDIAEQLSQAVPALAQ